MNWLNPEKVDGRLKEEMELYERHLAAVYPGTRIVVHSDWREKPSAGVSVDQHTFGKAVDFHVEGMDHFLAWLELERFGGITGIGLYPYWKPVPGFHADVRQVDIRARWARSESDAYVAADGKMILAFKEGGATRPPQTTTQA